MVENINIFPAVISAGLSVIYIETIALNEL
jgi:hypothetical protein